MRYTQVLEVLATLIHVSVVFLHLMNYAVICIVLRI